MIRAVVASFILLLSTGVFAQTKPVPTGNGVVNERPSETLKEDAEKGWFFYKGTKKPPEPAPEFSPAPLGSEPPPPKEERCKSKESWTADCGFVDPGQDFEFQSKQRDALLQAMSLSRNDPKSVENFQYYIKWVMERASEVANLWYYNTVQNPELDGTVRQPISTFGLKLMTEVKNSESSSILDALKDEGAVLIYFTRHDCAFCHSMESIVRRVAKDTGLEIWNTPIDDVCMPKMKDRCKQGDLVLKSAQVLQVSIVPTLFLYVPDSTWIRLATGVVDESTIKARTTSFFSAYRTALLKGVNNTSEGIAPVDFSQNDPTGAAEGLPTSAKGPLVPSQAEIEALLGK
jgi:hypothetical protein